MPSPRNNELMATARELVETNRELRRTNRVLRLELACTQRASKFLLPTLDNVEDGRTSRGNKRKGDGVSRRKGRRAKT